MSCIFNRAFNGFLSRDDPAKAFYLSKVLRMFSGLSMAELFKDLQTIDIFLLYKNFKWSREEKREELEFFYEKSIKGFRSTKYILTF